MQRIINGIQQVGIGVSNAAAAFEWYKKHFHFDAIVFEDVAKASLMKRYTGGEVHERYAILTMNMQGGGGFEIWQYTSRNPKSASTPIVLGDTGIFAIKLKSRDVAATHRQFTLEGLNMLTNVAEDPAGQKHFFMKDPFNNIFQLIENDYWFQKKSSLVGGVCGAVICVSNMEKAIPFYQNVLDYKQQVYTGAEANDLSFFAINKKIKKRVLLKNSPSFCGAFSKLLGPTSIELIQVVAENEKKIYGDRWWGDLGFMHICYDLCSMKKHEAICKSENFSLTVSCRTIFL